MFSDSILSQDLEEDFAEASAVAVAVPAPAVSNHEVEEALDQEEDMKEAMHQEEEAIQEVVEDSIQVSKREGEYIKEFSFWCLLVIL